MPRRINNPHATKAKQPARDINRAERQVLALKLRKEGHDWQTIAEMCSIRGGKGAAFNLVNSALKANLREHSEALQEQRELEAQRLDDLQAVYWPKALSGDGWSFDRVLRLMERRAALLGLDAKPDQTQAQAQMVVIGVPQAVLEAV